MRSRNFLLLVATVLSFIFMSGTGRDDVPLKNYHEFAKDSSFNCVGELYVQHKFVNGCVLIGKRFIVTTAHSLYLDSKQLLMDSLNTPVGYKPFKRPAFTYPAEPKSIYVKMNGEKFYCKQFFIHPDYSNSFHADESYDIALIELQQPVSSIQPPAIYKGVNELNHRGVHAGYGDVSVADEFMNRKRHKRLKMAGENMIDSVCKITLWADMDHPRLSGFNRMGDEKPLPLECIGDGGDCGSALFIYENNKRYLAGIAFAPAYYTDMYNYGKKYGVYYGFITGWTRISAFSNWIEKTTSQ